MGMLIKELSLYERDETGELIPQKVPLQLSELDKKNHPELLDMEVKIIPLVRGELRKVFNLDGKDSDDLVLIYFESEDTSATLAWPEQRSIELSEGFYNISVYVYRNQSIYIPATKTQKCVETASPGILGIFGATTEQCFDLEIPGQTLSNVIIGGGRASQYITESELELGRAEIEAESLPLPRSIEDLQNNYNLLEGKTVYVDFK